MKRSFSWLLFLTMVAHVASPAACCAQDAEKPGFLILVHPSAKVWAEPMADRITKDLNLHKNWFVMVKTPKFPQPPRVQIEVGTSAKAAKDWRYCLQFGAPKWTSFGLGFPGSSIPHVSVTYAFWFRAAPDDAPVQLATGNLQVTAGDNSGRRDADFGGDSVTRRLLGGSIAKEIREALASKIFASRGTVVLDDRQPQLWVPVEVAKDGATAHATIKLHNRLPFAVNTTFRLQANPELKPYDLYLDAPGGSFNYVFLEPGEEKAYTVRLKELKDVPVARWAHLLYMQIVDAELAAHEK